MSLNKHHTWSALEYACKQIIDQLFALLLLLLLFPIFIVIAFLIFVTSGRPVLYSQQRLGKNKVPFTIYKYRTMKVDAEEEFPLLASDEDDRITKLGKILRKWRLDELPQLYNVLRADMSFVGPRPERDFFVHQLVQQVEHYDSIFSVKPGITSSGMVNYGYASTIEEMKERAVYDIQYMRSLSIKNDLKILLQTVLVVLDGRGK